MFTNPRIRPDFALAVEGFALDQSVDPGEPIRLCCASQRPTSIAVTVSRIGAQREVVWLGGGIAVEPQPVPDKAYRLGCEWPVTVEIPTEGWRSGFHEIELRDEHLADDDPAARSHAFAVVRAGSPSGDAILLVLATNTYQAYNTWGGGCLYTGAKEVSFRRPIDRGFVFRPPAAYDGRVASIAPDGDPGHHQLLDYLDEHRYPLWCASSGWHNWERRFVRWAESAGFEIDVAVNADLETIPGLLDGYRLVCSVGHDEYWSWGMRDAFDSFVERGGNHLILSGNTSFWQVRLDHERGVMVCHKGSAPRTDDVADPTRMTHIWSSPAIGRPETSTTGLSFTRGGYVRVGRGVLRSSGAYTVHRSDHWAFAGTDLCDGDLLGLGSYVVGYEVDGCAFTTIDGVPVPTYEDGAPESLEILASSPARLLSKQGDVDELPAAIWADASGPGDLEDVATILYGSASPEHTDRLAHGQAMIATFRRGAGTVFNVGSTDWCYGLDSDPLIQRVTANVIHRLAGESGDV